MSYEQEYKRYKRMYLDLKKKQRGGDNGSGTADSQTQMNPASTISTGTVNSTGKTTTVLTQPENIITSRSIQDYQNLVTKLKTYCQQNVSNNDQIKEKLLSVYNFLNSQQLSEYNIPNIFNNKEAMKDIDFNKLHSKVCGVLLDKIIPYLENRKDLQEKFMQAIGNAKIQGSRIDIDKYLDYARENNLMKASVANIVNSYNSNAKKLEKYYKDENERADFFQNILKSDIVQSTGLVSSSGKICKSSCTKRHSTLRGDYWACDTDPYESFFIKYDWDYCKEPGK